MDEETKKIIDDQFNSLPKTVQEAIAHSGWEKKIHDLAKKYQLHIDQEGALVNEAFLVLLGLELSDDFKQNLIDNVGVTKEMAETFTTEINELIFKPIRVELQEINKDAPAPEEEGPLLPEASGLDRDDILREIEDPTPSKATPTQINEKAIISEPTPPPQTTNLIEDKISKITRLPQETVDNSKDQKPPEKKPYSADPYREPAV